MEPSTSNAEPIAVHVMSGRGYVWSVAAVKYLRQQHRLVGAMVGGLTSFTNQLDVHGLPLRLSPEEVTLGLRKGWLAVYNCISGLPQASTSNKQPSHQKQQPKRKRQEEQAADDYYSDYYADAGAQHAAEQDAYADYYAGAGGKTATEQDPYADYYADTGPNAASAEKEHADYYESAGGQGAPQHDEYADYYSSGGGDATAPERDHGASTPGLGSVCSRQQQQEGQQGPQAWHGAIKDGAWFEMPTTAQEAVPVNPGMWRGEPLQPLKWTYPSTAAEQLSYAVFEDLHQRGFTITPGSKFGGQYLLYPGDPKLYHAQFVVRAVPWGQSLDLVLLKSIARGVHAARKHLLLATAQPLGREGSEGIAGGGRPTDSTDAGTSTPAEAAPKSRPTGAAFGPISYITIARETGFVSSKPSNAAAAGPQPLPAVARGLAPQAGVVQAAA